MYEQPDTPVRRRILWLVVWFVAIVAVVAVLGWLLFFRHNAATKTAQPPKPMATQQQPAKPSQTSGPNSSSGQGGTPGSGSTQPVAPNSTAAPVSPGAPSSSQQPQQLANTGPGDVITPVVTAVVAGAGGYYLYTRKKHKA